MALDYGPKKGPSIISYARKPIMNRQDLKIDDSILATQDMDVIPEENSNTDLLQENMDYSPAIGNFASPIANRDRDITDLNQDNPSDDPLLKTDEDVPTSIFNDEDDTTKVPSELIDYFSEAALTAKQRKRIPDELYGLPRTRQYPLNDRTHVLQAIRMFHHCKDPKDQATLAHNIFKRVNELKIDVTIGKNNKLYEYAPKALQESSTAVQISPDMIENKPLHKRTKDEIIREHLNQHALGINHIMYDIKQYQQSIAAMKEFNFFEYFYPNLKDMNFVTRLYCMLGGLGRDASIYNQLGIRFPLETDDTIPLNWFLNSKIEDIETVINLAYDNSANWIYKHRCDDINHIVYCLRLYSILGLILTDPNFTMDKLSETHVGILLDWQQHVQYHYDLMKDQVQYSPAYLEQAQYLFDLCWNINDNPEDANVALSNIIEMTHQMAVSVSLAERMNEATELLQKEDCVHYLVHDLGMPEDIFLLPAMLKYPVINSGSIKMAMDIIPVIEKEYPEQLSEYVKNLNRKYKEFSCTFSISIDHPYAKYADQNIIDHINHILMEGETAVSDQGTSAGPVNYGDSPYYIRNDITGTVGRNLLDNKELGPNDGKKRTEIDYEQVDSFK